MHTQKGLLRFWNLGGYHDFNVQSDTLLLADEFENFWNRCLKIHGMDHACFPSAPGWPWKEALRREKYN